MENITNGFFGTLLGLIIGVSLFACDDYGDKTDTSNRSGLTAKGLPCW